MEINKKKQGGFTLLEILLVVGIIAILAGIVIVAINPAKQLADARNAQRRSDVNAISSAFYQYVIDHPTWATGFSLPEGNSSSCLDIIGSDTICTQDSPCNYGIDLSALIVDDNTLIYNGKYMTTIPYDPTYYLTDQNHTGYSLVEDATSHRITVCAPYAENGAIISITR